MRAILIIAALLSLSSPALAQAGAVPNLKLTPGVSRPELTLKAICTTKWGKDTRAVTASMKKAVFLEYGFPKQNKDARCPCEIDHLVSRELGGADDVKNLWVQAYSGPWNAHMKDRVENRLHKEVCAGTMSLDAARSGIVKDWTKFYVQFFGEPPPS